MLSLSPQGFQQVRRIVWALCLWSAFPSKLVCSFPGCFLLILLVSFDLCALSEHTSSLGYQTAAGLTVCRSDISTKAGRDFILYPHPLFFMFPSIFIPNPLLHISSSLEHASRFYLLSISQQCTAAPFSVLHVRLYPLISSPFLPLLVYILLSLSLISPSFPSPIILFLLSSFRPH